MLRSGIVLLLIYSIIFATLAVPATAQQVPAKQPTRPAAQKETNKAEVDLKLVFDRETARFNAYSVDFDPVKADRENAQARAQKEGWSKTKKTLVITAVVVGIAALTFLLIKYYKKCIRYEDNCDPFYDQYCQCAEYEEKNR